MRTILRFQSQLLYRRSYKPARLRRFRPSGRGPLSFRPGRTVLPLASYVGDTFPVEVRREESAPEAA